MRAADFDGNGRGDFAVLAPSAALVTVYRTAANGVTRVRSVSAEAVEHPQFGAPIAPGLPQGSVVMIAEGREQVVVTGTGGGHA